MSSSSLCFSSLIVASLHLSSPEHWVSAALSSSHHPPSFLSPLKIVFQRFYIKQLQIVTNSTHVCLYKVYRWSAEQIFLRYTSDVHILHVIRPRQIIPKFYLSFYSLILENWSLQIAKKWYIMNKSIINNYLPCSNAKMKASYINSWNWRKIASYQALLHFLALASQLSFNWTYNGWQ